MQTAGEAEEMEVEPEEARTPPLGEHAPLVTVDGLDPHPPVAGGRDETKTEAPASVPENVAPQGLAA